MENVGECWRRQIVQLENYRVFMYKSMREKNNNLNVKNNLNVSLSLIGFFQKINFKSSDHLERE